MAWSVKSRVKGGGGGGGAGGNGPFVRHTEKNGQKITQPKNIANIIGEAIINLPHIIQLIFSVSKIEKTYSNPTAQNHTINPFH